MIISKDMGGIRVRTATGRTYQITQVTSWHVRTQTFLGTPVDESGKPVGDPILVAASGCHEVSYDIEALQRGERRLTP